MAKKRKKYKGRRPISKTTQRDIKQKKQQVISKADRTDALLSRKRHKPFNVKLNEIQDDRDKRPKRNLKIGGNPALIGYAITREVRRMKPGYKIGSVFGRKYRIKPYSVRTRVQHHFLDKRRTVVCWRRKIRRAVLFAQGKTGRGSRATRRRFNQNSKISCKRR